MSSEEEVLTLLKQVFEKHRHRLQGYQILLFGSRATSKAKPRSDFDVGVIGDQALPLEDFYAIAEDLENLPTLYSIDWVDLNRASAKLRDKAMCEGKLIYAA